MMQPRNIRLVLAGAVFFLIGTIMLYCTTFDPQSAYAGYALASHIGGLAIASIAINDETRQSRKDRSRK